MSKICVVGAGYVGLVTAACLAELGHDVTCLEKDVEKATAISDGLLPIKEPQLKELWHHSLSQNRLRITTDYGQGIRGCQFIFLCVNTPSSHKASTLNACALS